MKVLIVAKEMGDMFPYPVFFEYEAKQKGNEEIRAAFREEGEEKSFQVFSVNGCSACNTQILNKWFGRTDFQKWDDYFDWFGRQVLRIEINDEVYFEDEAITA